MKLSEVVAYRNHIDSLTIDTPAVVANRHCGPVLDYCNNHHITFPDLTQEITKQVANVQESIQSFNQVVDNLKKELSRIVTALEPEYYVKSLELYNEAVVNDTVDAILGRQLEIPELHKAHIRAQLAKYSSWEHPGMVIRPCTDSWTDMLVGSDPLYFLDTNMGLVTPVLEKYTKEYQRRLRTYAINESINDPMLKLLPDNQFSLCLAYYFFNFKPIEIIQRYIQEVFQKLKPGGCLAMTINDCDRWGGVVLAENNFASYTPASAIYGHARNIGYDVRNIYPIDNSTTWVELVKPGQLSSLRGGQTLARILPK
jgi:hypothetical protein